MAPLKYGDFFKSVEDLINNDYCFDKKFKLKSKTENGYEITTEGVLKGNNSVTAKLTSKIPLGNGITLNKLGVSHDGRFFADASYAGVMKGLSLSTLIEDLGNRKPVGEIGATYKHKLFTAKCKLDAMNGPTLKESISCQYENFIVGTDLKVDTGLDKKQGVELKDYSIGACYKENDLTVSAQALRKLSEYKLGFHHQVNPDVQVGAVFSKGKSQTLEIGGLYKLDKYTTLQGKAHSSGLVSVNAIQKISSRVKMIASASVDAKSLAADTHKFGLQMHVA